MYLHDILFVPSSPCIVWYNFAVTIMSIGFNLGLINEVHALGYSHKGEKETSLKSMYSLLFSPCSVHLCHNCTNSCNGSHC